MISAITSIKDMNISIRGQLVIQSELDASHVLSAESVRGTIMQKQKSKDIWESFTIDDTVIMYDLTESSTTDDMIEETDDEELLTFMSYTYHITVYGENSHILARKLKARFLSEEVILALQKVGIHLQQISNIENGDEFINQTYWHRNDFDINVAVRFDCARAVKADTYSIIDNIEIITK